MWDLPRSGIELHWQADSYSLCHQAIPWNWVLYLCVLSHFWLFATLWTVACQAPRSMGFSKGSSPARDRTRVSSTGRQILYCCATWDSSIKKSPRGTEVLNKHQQNRTQAPLLSQKPGCRGRKVPQDWVMLGKELLFPLYLSQPQLLLFQLQTKVQDSTHKKPGWPLFQEEQNLRWFNPLAGRWAEEDKEMDKEQIKQPQLSYLPLLTPFPLLSLAQFRRWLWKQRPGLFLFASSTNAT